MIYITEENDVLDAILHKQQGSSANISEVLAKNPVLGAYGAHLPAGLQLELPEPEKIKTEKKKVVALWD